MSIKKPEAGILIETSVAIRIKLKDLNTKKHFIIADLDDHHLFVDENYIEWIREEIQRFQDDKNKLYEGYHKAKESLFHQNQFADTSQDMSYVINKI